MLHNLTSKFFVQLENPPWNFPDYKYRYLSGAMRSIRTINYHHYPDSTYSIFENVYHLMTVVFTYTRDHGKS